MIPAILTALIDGYRKALRQHRIERLTKVNRTIERITCSLGLAYLAEPGPRHPAYGEFQVNVARAQRYLEQQIALQTKLHQKLEQ